MENALPWRGLKHCILTLLVAGSWLPLLVAGGAVYDPPPLDISRSNGPIFKIQTVYDSTQFDLHFKKKI